MADAKSICLELAGIFTLSTLAVPAHDEVWRAPDAAGAPAGDAPRTSPPVDPFEKRCAQLAASGGLSKREAEVLALLARGRSRPYIRDELFLSKNTVSTHVRHIY
ncbi:MAG: response regulator transcription factor, partial [Eggerthellaceae bacterium]